MNLSGDISSCSRVPVVFEGDMAYVAACHLKEKDLVYISGQLRGSLPFVHTDHGQAKVQVRVVQLVR